MLSKVPQNGYNQVMQRKRRELAEEKPMRRFRGVLVAMIALGAVGAAVLVSVYAPQNPPQAEAAGSRFRLDDIPFSGAGAYDYLKQLCALGPRPSGSQGMAAQQKLLTEHFTRLGGKVSLQRFQTRHPVDGSTVPLANLIVEWHPDRTERILLCAHYDTLPYPMMDRENPRGVFVGANDGASGVAILMELGCDMPGLSPPYGVDFVFFDAEEFLFIRRGPIFLARSTLPIAM